MRFAILVACVAVLFGATSAEQKIKYNDQDYDCVDGADPNGGSNICDVVARCSGKTDNSKCAEVAMFATVQDKKLIVQFLGVFLSNEYVLTTISSGVIRHVWGSDPLVVIRNNVGHLLKDGNVRPGMNWGTFSNGKMDDFVLLKFAQKINADEVGVNIVSNPKSQNVQRNAFLACKPGDCPTAEYVSPLPFKDCTQAMITDEDYDSNNMYCHQDEHFNEAVNGKLLLGSPVYETYQKSNGQWVHNLLGLRSLHHVNPTYQKNFGVIPLVKRCDWLHQFGIECRNENDL